MSTGGIPAYVVDRVTGILVPEYSAAPLAEAVVGLLSADGLRNRFSKASRRHVMEGYQGSTFAGNLDAVVRGVLDRSR